jgi:hypothetical protein
LKEEFEVQNSSAVPSAAQPRYPPARSILPQRPDREHEARPDNYEYGNTGAGGFYQGSAGQWEGMNSPNTYGSQNPYVSQNAAGPYGAPTLSYSSQPRPGFPGARSAQPGYTGWQEASNQSPAPSGYQDQYQHQALGHPITFSQYNPPLLSGHAMQSVYPSQYSSAGHHVVSPTSPYQPGAHESSWQTEHYNQYGGSNRLTGSLRDQYYSSAQTDQSVPPHSTQPYSTPLDNVSPSEIQVDPALASQALYAETPYSPAQDEMSTIEPATLGGRKQPIYRSSHGAKVDSSVIESESETQTSHKDEPDSEATVGVPSFQVPNKQRSQNIKSMSFYQL